MTRFAFGGAALILLILTLCCFSQIAPGGDLGICLPSPNQWALPKFIGWFLNSFFIGISVLLLYSANKKYNFCPEATPFTPLILILLLACNSLSSATLSTSTLLLLCNMLCFFIIMSTYEETNATREFFVIGTLPAIGAMFQYAFLIMIPVYIGAGLLMKSFRLRELLAFVFGLLAPYWIALGLGLVSPFSFQLPGSLTVLNRSVIYNDIFLSLLSAGIMALIGFILSLYTSIRLLSRNSRLRCMHMSFNLMGYVAVLAMIFDFNNFLAYFGTIAFWVAVELGAVLHFYNIRRPQMALVILLAIFLPIYFVAL